MNLPALGVENHPDGTGDLNAIVNGNWAILDATINPVFGTTASQAATTVTSSVAIFTSSHIGFKIQFLNGAVGTIQAGTLNGTPATTCTLNVSQTVAAQSWWLYDPAATAFDALIRGLMKLPNVSFLSTGDMFAWDNVTNRVIKATGYNGSKGGSIFNGTADVTLANSGAETSIVPTGAGSVQIPAAYPLVGKRIRVRARGFLSTISSPGTIEAKLYHGTVVVLDTGTPTPPGSLVNALWKFEGDYVFRTIGATGTVHGQGVFDIVGQAVLPMLNTAVVPGIDTTANKNVGFKFQWGTANAGNTITTTDFAIEVLN